MKRISFFPPSCGSLKLAVPGQPWIWLVCFWAILIATNAAAATWYVDSSATGANNGTNWTNAWTSLSSASGSSVHAGDTVYISGGPAGSYRTYTVSSWIPKGGTAGNPITYQIGQDASHNGTAAFIGTGTWLHGSLAGIVISGDAGDGKMHFTIANPSTGNPSDPTTWICPFATILEGYSTGTDNYLRISYVNFGVNLTGSSLVLTSGGTGNEFDHIFCNFSNLTSGDIIFHLMNTAGTTWDSWKIHDNTMYVVHTYNDPGYGIDAIQGAGNGVSIYNNTVVSFPSAYSSSQHGDTFQILGGDYWKVYGNVSINVGDMGIYFAAWPGSSYNHIYVYNNIVIGTGMGIYFGSDNPGSTFNDIRILNNVVQGGYVFYGRSATGDTFTNSLVANNIITGGGGVSLPNNSGTPSMDNVTLSDSLATNSFVSYVAGSMHNDYHLKAAATSLIGQGTNLSSYFSTDFMGNTRPSSGNWDIGAYEYLQAIPVMNAVLPSGANLIISGTNGSPNGNYLVLASTNPLLPRTNWTRLSTNSFNGSGSFIFTNPITPNKPGLFYLLQSQ